MVQVRMRLMLATSALCALAAACPGRTPQPPRDAGGADAGRRDVDAGPGAVIWERAFDTTQAGSVSMLWGSAPDDVFAVGGNDDGATVTHWDGVEWTAMTVPSAPQLVWVRGFAADDVFAVGLGGTVMHYDGAQWTAMDAATSVDLWGVFGFARDDLWIVGGETDTGDPLILHWDGAAFTQSTLDPAQNPDSAHALFKVWGIGSRLLAVGQRGLIVERQGDAWVRRPAGDAADDDFVSLWGTTEDDIVVVGGRANARVAVWDGAEFQTTAIEGLPGLNAVFMDAPGSALVAGVEGTAAVMDIATRSFTLEATNTRFDLHGLWGDGAGRHYAVGGSFVAPNRGVALVRRVDDDEADAGPAEDAGADAGFDAGTIACENDPARTLVVGDHQLQFVPLQDGAELPSWDRPQGGVGTRISALVDGFTLDDVPLVRVQMYGPATDVVCDEEADCEQFTSCREGICTYYIVNQTYGFVDAVCRDDGTVFLRELEVQFRADMTRFQVDHMPIEIIVSLEPADAGPVRGTIDGIIDVGPFIQPSWWDDL